MEVTKKNYNLSTSAKCVLLLRRWSPGFDGGVKISGSVFALDGPEWKHQCTATQFNSENSVDHNLSPYISTTDTAVGVGCVVLLFNGNRIQHRREVSGLVWNVRSTRIPVQQNKPIPDDALC